MSNSLGAVAVPESTGSRHRRAARAFTRQVRERYGDAVATILLYGSVARGEERGVHSDVDLLVVLRDHIDATQVEDDVRDLASDVQLDYEVVRSLIVMTATEYENRLDRPFLRNVHREPELLYDRDRTHEQPSESDSLVGRDGSLGQQ